MERSQQKQQQLEEELKRWQTELLEYRQIVSLYKTHNNYTMTYRMNVGACVCVRLRACK